MPYLNHRRYFDRLIVSTCLAFERYYYCVVIFYLHLGQVLTNCAKAYGSRSLPVRWQRPLVPVLVALPDKLCHPPYCIYIYGSTGHRYCWSSTTTTVDRRIYFISLITGKAVVVQRLPMPLLRGARVYGDVSIGAECVSSSLTRYDYVQLS